MSHVEIYAIRHNGEVCFYDGDVHNACAGALHIWECLSQKHTPKANLMNGYKELFQLPARQMEEWEHIALDFTRDGTWIKRENLSRVCAALDTFWEHHHQATSKYTGEKWKVTATIPGIVSVLRKLAQDTSFRGACFNQTSVNTNPWQVRINDDGEEDAEYRPYNFDMDVGRPNLFGKVPVEIFEHENLKPTTTLEWEDVSRPPSDGFPEHRRYQAIMDEDLNLEVYSSGEFWFWRCRTGTWDAGSSVTFPDKEEAMLEVEAFASLRQRLQATKREQDLERRIEVLERRR